MFIEKIDLSTYFRLSNALAHGAERRPAKAVRDLMDVIAFAEYDKAYGELNRRIVKSQTETATVEPQKLEPPDLS